MEALQYSLGDFLLFSESTYLELLRYYHQDVWPTQLLALLLAGYCCWQLTRASQYGLPRILLLFAISWWWIGLNFLGNYYRDINWVVHGFVWAFCLQGGGLLWLAFRLSRHQPTTGGDQYAGYFREGGKQGSSEGGGKGSGEGGGKGSGVEGRAAQPSLARRGLRISMFAAWLLLLAAMLVLPVSLKLTGRHWDQLELVFMTADATAIATLGLILLVRQWAGVWPVLLLMVMPLVWCAFSLLTWLAMISLRGG